MKDWKVMRVPLRFGWSRKAANAIAVEANLRPTGTSIINKLGE